MNPKTIRTIRKFGLMVKKNIPTIISFASAGGVIVTGIFSARAAIKSSPVIEEYKEKMELLKSNKETFENQKEYKKEVFSVCKDTAVGVAKQSWPAVTAAGLTVFGILKSDRMHRMDYAKMAGMYATLFAGYTEYRKRVAEKYGSEAEKDIYYDMQREEIVTVETDKKGKEKTKVETIFKPGFEHDANYTTWLIDTNDKLWYWRKPELTKYYLDEQQRFLTDLLQSRGFVFLNEVLRALHKPEIPEGQFIGWVYDEDKATGDNYIDFGLVPGTENYDLFMSGKNEFVYITLNHDGVIYDKFPRFDRVWKRNNAGRV